MHFTKLLLALTSLSSCIYAQQEPLQSSQHRASTSSFIQSSIFGRQRRLGVQAIVQDPIPPSYQLRGFDDDIPFSGINTFAHLNWTNCFAPESNGTFDIAIVGAPFDLGVAYRPGARFGPTGARMGARRISPSAGWELVQYTSTEPLKFSDCWIACIVESTRLRIGLQSLIVGIFRIHPSISC
jgi:agmatinase